MTKIHIPEKVIASSGIEEIEPLLLAVKDERSTRYEESSNERGQRLSHCTIRQRGPTIHIEVTRPKHMLGINLTRIGINEIVINKHLIPPGNEVRRQIVRRFEITVHSKESSEVTIDRIVESDRIYPIFT